MIRSLHNAVPKLDATVRVAENATVLGDVRLGKDCSVWYGAVLRGDTDYITFADRCNVQDNAVVHCTKGFPVTVGEGTTVGHGAILHGCTIGKNCLVGMGATILNGAVIGDHCLVGAGALVTEGKQFPPHSLIVGVPGKVLRTLEGEDAEKNDAATEENAETYCREAAEELPLAAET